MNLIADTNVWYAIASGIRDPDRLKSGGNRLVATPISFLEIASKIDDDTFEERKAAATAVVVHADYIEEDSESHLARLWGLPTPDSAYPWIDAFKAVAQANSVAELESGVADFQERVIRKLNVPLLEVARTFHWKDFKDSVDDALDTRCPGFKAARARGQYIYLKKKGARDFAEDMKSEEVRRYIVESTFIRAQSTHESLRSATESEYGLAEGLVAPYVNAYIEYVIGCSRGEFAPQPNDLGDSECFLYLQNDNVFLSGDGKWVRLARKACPSHCYDPEMKVP